MRKLVLTLFTLPILLFVMALSGWFYSVQRLTNEAALMEINFRQIEPQHYVATLQDENGCLLGNYEIHGDQWRIDAQFIKWKTLATLAGLDARYRLERLSGRYTSVHDANRQPHLVHDISQQPTLDLVTLSSSLGRLNFLLDAEYGSSTYQAIDTNFTYRVYRTQSGLISRSQPRHSAQLDEAGLTIRIDRACAQSGPWQQLVQTVDLFLKRLLQSIS